jgi:hypothetical protein
VSGKRRGGEVHRRRRISPEMLAGATVSDEEFLGFGGVSGGEGKRDEGGGLWLFIAEVA